MAAASDFVKRFERQAAWMRKPQRRNVPRVDDIGASEDGRPFIIEQSQRRLD